MSRSHPRRTGGEHLAFRIGFTVVLAGALSTNGLASQRDVDRGPVVLAKALRPVLPEIAEDEDLVNISTLVEPAPEVFDGKGRVVWDGKATFSGVWVAHPMTETTRRVRIFNLANGAVVDGALLKREPKEGDNRVIISSDAASKLGLEVNIPTQLRIVAVRPVENANDGRSDDSSPAAATDRTEAAPTGEKISSTHPVEFGNDWFATTDLDKPDAHSPAEKKKPATTEPVAEYSEFGTPRGTRAGPAASGAIPGDPGLIGQSLVSGGLLSIDWHAGTTGFEFVPANTEDLSLTHIEVYFRRRTKSAGEN